MKRKPLLPLPLEQDKLYETIKIYNSYPEHRDVTGFIKTLITTAQNGSKSLYEELNRYAHREQNAYAAIKAQALMDYIEELTTKPINYSNIDKPKDSLYSNLAAKELDHRPKGIYRKHISRYYASGVGPGLRRTTTSNYDKHIPNKVLIRKILDDGDLEAVVVFCVVLASLGG